jgi:ribosomal protein L34E
MAPVHGGVAFTECPQSEGWWTPHSHWLVLCKSEPDEKMLGREWMKVMGDSFDVQVDRVSVFKKFGDRRDGLFWPELRTEVFRLAQYGTKPANRTPTGKIRFHFARRKTCDGKFRRAKRLVNSYGIVRGVKVVRPPKAKRRGLRFRCSTAGSNYKEVKPDPRDQVAGPSNCDAPKRGRR